MLIEQMFSSKSKMQLLRVFYNFPKREFWLEELKKITKHSSGTIYPPLSEMVKSGVILSRKAGRSTFYRLNYQNPLIKKMLEIFETESNFLLKAAKDFARELNKRDVISIIAFGSVARGEAKFNSDIDILIIYQKSQTIVKRNVDELVRDYLEQDINISPILYSKKQVTEMEKRFNPFMMRIEEEGKVLWQKK